MTMIEDPLLCMYSVRQSRALKPYCERYIFTVLLARTISSAEVSGADAPILIALLLINLLLFLPR